MYRDTNHPSFYYENIFWKKDIDLVIGLDEVGRGAFAGPVVVGAVVFSKHSKACVSPLWEKLLKEVRDSKLLSPNKRQELNLLIKKLCLQYAIGKSSVKFISKYGIQKATVKAARNAVSRLRKLIGNKKIFLLVDGFPIKYLRYIGLENQKAIIRGDRQVFTIACASILAKVERDKIMSRLHNKYPNYGFSIHKGYGTLNHIKSLQKHGLCDLHRTSFDIKKFLTNQSSTSEKNNNISPGSSLGFEKVLDKHSIANLESVV